MNDIIRKLTSRKLWLALAGVATGIAMAFGADASDIQSVTGAVTAVISAVAYILTEGKVDAARVAEAVESVQEAASVVESADNPPAAVGGTPLYTRGALEERMLE